MINAQLDVKRFQVVNTLLFFFVIVVNALANIIPVGGYNTGEISDMYPNLFVPIPLTFSIWLIIYIGLGLFILYQWGFLSGWSDDHRQVTADIGWVFALSCLLNGLWIFLWHYLYTGLSLIVMFLLLFSLLVIYQRLWQRKSKTAQEKRYVVAPFSLYFGWITVATIANVTTVLVDLGWDGFGISDEIWTTIMIAAAFLITLGVLFTKRDLIYGLVVVWTVAGIYLRHTGELMGEYPLIIFVAAVTGGVLLLLMALMGIGVIGKGQPKGTLYYQ